MAFIIDTQYRDALMGAFCSSPTAPNALSLFFQPQVNMHTGDVLGYEALLRWFDPTFGYVSPEKCLEIVDFYHLNDHLNQWLIIQAVSSLTKIQPHQYITINLCAASLTMTLAKDLFDALLAAKCDPRRIHVEITEHKAPKSFTDLAKTVAWLRRQGIQVALDDFGTGHATMTYLTYIDFDTIKIDKSYIQGIDFDKTKRDILKHLLSLIAISDATVLVEGIETEGEVTVLKNLGLTLAQGYFYGRPASLIEVTDKAASKVARQKFLSIVQKA